jgi:hypothetical protein
MALTRRQHVERGKRALLAMVERHLAAIWMEAQARASDARWGDERFPVDPEHLWQARDELVTDGSLKWTGPERTRGGRPIDVIIPGDTRGRVKPVEAAAARKRLLQTRYLSWASGTKDGDEGGSAGVIGPEAERVVHSSMREAGHHLGFRFEEVKTGQASTFLGERVQGGPLDNAVHFHIDHIPYSVAVEVKSIRDHVYPSSVELYQLLWKAARLQQALPTANIVPVLVCRRANKTLFYMAKDLGFLVFQSFAQWIQEGGRTTSAAVNEVRNELSYLDLHVVQPSWDRLDPGLEGYFRKVLAGQAKSTAANWRLRGSRFGTVYETAHRAGSGAQARTAHRQLRQTVRGELGPRRGW